jgi:hypothetical protein
MKPPIIRGFFVTNRFLNFACDLLFHFVSHQTNLRSACDQGNHFVPHVRNNLENPQREDHREKIIIKK